MNASSRAAFWLAVGKEAHMVEMRMIGTSGIEVAPLALGGNVFGWTADEATSFAILDAFVDAGGTMIDTADVYSAWVPGNQGGESETVIGRWLKRDPAKRDKVVIATKVGFLAGLAPDTIGPACDASLQRLGIDTIDLYYQHKDDESVPLADSLGAFDELAKAGKIRAIGLSQFTAPRLRQAMDTAAADGLLKPCCLQTWYNMVEREKLEGELRDTALAHGLGIFPFYSLATVFSPANTAARKTSTKARAACATSLTWKARGSACWMPSTRSPPTPVPRSRLSRSRGRWPSPESPRL